MNPEAMEVMRSVEDTHWWYRSLHRSARMEVGSAVRILDLGCGTGGMLTHLWGKEAVGLDRSRVALSHARARGVGRLVLGDGAHLPFGAGTFDALLCLDLLYHKNVPDEGAVLAECHRVLAPGGTIVIQAAAFNRYYGGHDVSVDGVRRHDLRAIRNLVEKAGFTIMKAGYRNFLALLLAEIFRRRVFRESAKDLQMPPLWINFLLDRISLVENVITARYPLPLGLSVWCVAKKGEGNG